MANPGNNPGSFRLRTALVRNEALELRINTLQETIRAQHVHIDHQQDLIATYEARDSTQRQEIARLSQEIARLSQEIARLRQRIQDLMDETTISASEDQQSQAHVVRF